MLKPIAATFTLLLSLAACASAGSMEPPQAQNRSGDMSATSTPGFTVRVYIYGLAALLKQADGSRDAVLVKTPDNGCHRHYPFLAARARSCSDEANCRMVDPGTADEAYEAVWYPLEDEVITLEGIGDTPPTSHEVKMYPYGVDLDQPKPQKKILESTSWIFPLTQRTADPLKEDISDYVVSRLELNSGEIRTHSLSTLRPDPYYALVSPAPVFTLALDGVSYKQALASSVVWERKFSGTALEVTAISEAGGPLRKMTLEPRDCELDYRRCIDLYYGNEPKVYQDGDECFDDDGDNKAEHFARYYQLFNSSKTAYPNVLNWTPRPENLFMSVVKTEDGWKLPAPADVDFSLANGTNPSDADACVIVQ